MAKKAVKLVKGQAQAGKASPAPPLGPVLGQAGININEFTTRFNADTQDKMGNVIPFIIHVFEDNSFDIEYKQPPMSKLIMKALGIPKGSGKNAVKKVGKLTDDQARAVAEEKMPDLNTADVNQAMQIVKGSARSMGVDTE